MSYTLFTSNPSALIAQPGRAVNTFPSGLVRVDQTYLGLTSQAATHRATLAVGNDMPDGDRSPCIDGLFIFPEAQEKRREDGFTEFLVSAYGRSNTTGQISSERDLINLRTVLFYYVEREPQQHYASRPALAEILKWSFVAPKDADVSILAPTAVRTFRLTGQHWHVVNLLEELPASLLGYDTAAGYYYYSGDPNGYVIPQIVDVLKNVVTPQEANAVKKMNFGEFDEWTVVYGPHDPSLTFGKSGGQEYYHIVTAPSLGDVNRLFQNGNGAKSLTLGPVLNYRPSAADGFAEVAIGDEFVSTYYGRAKFSYLTGASPYKIHHDFGYVNEIGDFVEFSAPPDVAVSPGNLPPPNVTTGPAEWEPYFKERFSDSVVTEDRYGYMLVKNAAGSRQLNDYFKWTAANEFGMESATNDAFQWPSDVDSYGFSQPYPQWYLDNL